MMKKISFPQIGLFLSVLLLCLFSLRASAAEPEATYVYDQAGLFSSDEIQQLNEEIQNLKSETDMDYVVVTTDDADGKTSRKYADDFYEATGLGTHDNYSGMLYLIDMDNREIYISTEGDMTRYLTDERIDTILNHAYTKVSNGDYAGSALAVLQDTDSYIAAGIPSNQYNYSSETGETDPYYQRGFPVPALVFGAIAGLIAALYTFFSVRRKYQLTAPTYHYPLSEKSELKLTVREDRLISQFVTHRKIPKSPPPSSGSGSGRTTTHVSGSGRVHGGGGRKF